ncbi:hypothetical protein [Aeribacillus sp. SP014]
MESISIFAGPVSSLPCNKKVKAKISIFLLAGNEKRFFLLCGKGKFFKWLLPMNFLKNGRKVVCKCLLRF